MATQTIDKTLEADLAALVGPVFPGVQVRVEHNKRWNRPGVTFTWSGFIGLLPEERFHKLTSVIPRALRETRLTGFVWTELAPGETVDAYLELPRSEETAQVESQVYAELLRIGFFRALAEGMGRSPEDHCRGDFSRTEAVLTAARVPASQVREAKLLFIRYGVYCDCQVLNTIKVELAKRHSGAA